MVSSVTCGAQIPSIEDVAKLHQEAVEAQNSGHWERAEEYHRATVEGLRQIPGVPPHEIARALSNLASTLNLLSKHVDAERALLEAQEILEKYPTDDPLQEAALYGNLGDAMARQGRLEEGEQYYQRSLQIVGATLGMDDIFAISMKVGLAYIYRQRGELELSKQVYEEALGAMLQWAGPDHPIVRKIEAEYEKVLQQIESQKSQ